PWQHRDRLVGAWFSPDGRHVLTASRDGTARVWETGKGDPVSPWLRHGSPLTSAAFAPDGRRVLTASQDGSVRLWDLATRAHGRPCLDHKAVLPAGQRSRIVEHLTDRTSRVRDVLPGHLVVAAHFTPDGRHLLTSAGQRIIDLAARGTAPSTSRVAP